MTESTEVCELYDKPEDMTTQTPIQNRYAFWYHRRGGKSQTPAVNYEESMKLLESFQTVEHFWRIYNHMVRPNDFRTTTDYHLFKDGIKPTWEDPQNKNGGKWMIRLKKGLASKLWEELILAIIGEQFDVGHEICGAVVSVRHSEDIISVWNKTSENVEATTKIRDQMRRILKVPASVVIEYKKHQDSLVDKSSFRNPSMVWRPTARINTQDRDNIKDGPKTTGSYYKNNNANSNSYHHRGGVDGGDGNRDNKDNTQQQQQQQHGQHGQGQAAPKAPWASSPRNPNQQHQQGSSGWSKRDPASGNAHPTTSPASSAPVSGSSWGRTNRDGGKDDHQGSTNTGNTGAAANAGNNTSGGGAAPAWGKRAPTGGAGTSDWGRSRSEGPESAPRPKPVSIPSASSAVHSHSQSTFSPHGVNSGFTASVAAKLGLSAPGASAASSSQDQSQEANRNNEASVWGRKKKDADE